MTYIHVLDFMNVLVKSQIGVNIIHLNSTMLRLIHFLSIIEKNQYLFNSLSILTISKYNMLINLQILVLSSIPRKLWNYSLIVKFVNPKFITYPKFFFKQIDYYQTPLITLLYLVILWCINKNK